MPWPNEKAPDLAEPGLPPKHFASEFERNEAMYQHLYEQSPFRRPVDKEGRMIPNDNPGFALFLISILSPEDIADPELWEELCRQAMRIDDEKHLKAVAMGIRMLKVGVDKKIRRFVIRRKKISGFVRTRGTWIARSFTMSDDPELNRKRARQGMICRFFKKEASKQWGDFAADDFESTPFGPLFTGCYLGFIAGIGQNKIYVAVLESANQRGIDAIDAELKDYYHMVYLEGATYVHQDGHSRPIFVRGLEDYKGRMMGTYRLHEVRYEDLLEIVPNACLTPESFVYILSQLPRYRKPEPEDDRQFHIPAKDKAWYTAAGCPESGELYKKDASGQLKSVRVAGPAAVNETSTSAVTLVDDDLSPGSKAQGKSGNSRAEQAMKVAPTPTPGADDVDERVGDMISPPLVPKGKSSGNSETPKWPKRGVPQKKTTAVLAPQTAYHRVSKTETATNKKGAVSKAAAMLAEEYATNGAEHVERGGRAFTDPQRADRAGAGAASDSSTVRRSTRLQDRGIDESTKSGVTRVGTVTHNMQQAMHMLGGQKLHNSRAQSVRKR